MSARRSFLALSKRGASLGSSGRIWSATWRHWTLVGLGKCNGCESRNDTTAALVSISQDIALKMSPAPPPDGGQNSVCSGTGSRMGVENHQLDACRPRLTRSQRIWSQGLGFECAAHGHARHFAPAVRVDADGEPDRNTENARWRSFRSVGSIHREGCSPSMGRVKMHRRARPSLRTTDVPVSSTVQCFLSPGQDRPSCGSTSLDADLLGHRCQHFLHRATRLEERRKKEAPGNTQINAARSDLPVSVAVAVALGQSVAAHHAGIGTSLGANLNFPQSFGRETSTVLIDHPAKQVGIGTLFDKRADPSSPSPQRKAASPPAACLGSETPPHDWAIRSRIRPSEPAPIDGALPAEGAERSPRLLPTSDTGKVSDRCRTA